MTSYTPTRRIAMWGAASAAALPFAAAAQMPQGVKLRTVKTNGINLRIAEMGKGPLVIFVHGWPESWYSWRRQMPALAAAGYRVVAPDMRGYGGSDKPGPVDDYDIRHTTGDLAGLVDALGETSAILVGHDWGAIVCWNAMLLHPQKFSALAAMSVPFGGRAAGPPIEGMKARFKDNFYYILYFQQPGAAEAEFDANPRAILSRLYTSPDTPTEPPKVTDPKMSAGGWIDRLGAPKALPPWLSQADLDYYVAEFKRAGFRGGINYYRNFDRNWQITPQLAGAKISQPVIFLAGEKDIVIAGARAEALSATMKRVCEDFRGVVLFPGAGHWVQQERSPEVNRTLVDFVKSVSGKA
jgi:pimeloyl-ACP methyl ester carboxylesterase